MFAVIHQAYFIPWLGYFNKLLYAKNFVILDNVQYNIRYFHNRTNIKSMQGTKIWLTLPVGSGNYGVMCKDITILNRNGLQKVFDSVHHCYKRAKFYDIYWPEIQDAINSGFPNLVTINTNVIKVLMRQLEIFQVTIWQASQLYQTDDRTDRLITLCKMTNSTGIILGQGGSCDCHDLNRMRENGLSIEVQTFIDNHPIYPQLYGPFVSRLSTIDALFNIGAIETRRLITLAWKPAVNF